LVVWSAVGYSLKNVPEEVTKDSRIYPLCVPGTSRFFKMPVTMKRFSDNTAGELLTSREEEEKRRTRGR
jgi:hypothetical protein